MLVYLTTTYPTQWSYLPRFRDLAAIDRFQQHQLTDDPEKADLILFVDARHEHGDWRFRRIVESDLAKRLPEKCFVYNETDQPWCFMPGLYVSMPAQWFDRRTMAAWSYIGLMNQYLQAESQQVSDCWPWGIQEPDLLFSFSGRRCAEVRDRVLKLKHPAAVIEDTSDFNFFGNANHTEMEMDARRREYAKLICRSRFILCPRGSGPASFRLFEALAAHRVPVIISDEWVAPEGPDWSACSIRVAESDVARIPSILCEMSDNWKTMADAAACVWKNWFAPEVQYHRMIEACGKIKSSSAHPVFQIINARKLWLEARGLRNEIRRLLVPRLRQWRG